MFAANCLPQVIDCTGGRTLEDLIEFVETQVNGESEDEEEEEEEEEEGEGEGEGGEATEEEGDEEAAKKDEL